MTLVNLGVESVRVYEGIVELPYLSNHTIPTNQSINLIVLLEDWELAE